MPIFEYRCGDCGAVFEFLVVGDETPKCPACGSKELKRLLSRFCANVKGGAGSCATCAGGSCAACGK